jgi:endoglucanase
VTVATPLSTSGRYITGSDGRRVKLAGVNWAGHFDPMVPCGLNYRHRDDLSALLVSLGINSVRLTFALRMLTYGLPVPTALVSANPDLAGATPWEVYQECVSALTAKGIMVIPNCHLLYPGSCCSGADGNGLWWNAAWPAGKFFAGWEQVAAAFKDNPLVVGYDIKNEPRATVIGGASYQPTWGGGNQKTDFRWMYDQAASLIHAIDPGKLIICEGLSYASTLAAAGAEPVSAPGKVVYSLHDYSWFHSSGQPYDSYKAAMDSHGGYLLAEGRAPVWIGEFGIATDKPSSMTTGWFANFIRYAKERDLDWSLWHLDATVHEAHVPQTNALWAEEDQREAFSLLATDWMGPSSRTLLAQLQSIMAPVSGPGI